MHGFENTDEPRDDEPQDLTQAMQERAAREQAHEGQVQPEQGHSHAGNRPASNAPVISPGEAFQDDWTGGEGAGDFLELESTLDAGTAGELSTAFGTNQPLPRPADPTAATATVEEQESLFGVDQHRSHVAFPEGRQHADGHAGDEHDLDFEDEDHELEHEDAEGSPVTRKLVVIGAGFGLGLVLMLAVGMLTGPDETPAVPVIPNTVAKAPAPDAATTSTDPEVEGPEATAGGESPVETPVVDPLSVDPASPTGTEPTPGAGVVAATDPTPAGGTAGTDTGPLVPGLWPQPELGTEVVGAGDGTDPAGTDGGDASTGSSGRDAFLAGLDPDNGELPAGGMVDQAGMMDLSGVTMIWQGENVPMEHIHSPAPIMTPAVGVVRVVLHSGDVFEGRLYAVGDGRIWIDQASGRIGFQESLLHKVERLGVDVAATAPVDVTPGMVGRRMRARTEGGRYIVGTLTKLEGARVTLRTDVGALISLTGAQVEPVGNHPAVRLKP